MNTTENKPKRETCPNLKCIVTGKDRLTNKKYLEQKAADAGVTVAEYLTLYISREALKGLRAGKTVADVRKELNSTNAEPISDETLQKAIKLNGKWSKAKE